MNNTPLTPETVRHRCEQCIAEIRPYSNHYRGRGIVICGGGSKYYPGAWVLVRMLRQFGCTLPIELWYLGEPEMSSRMRALIEPYEVICVDALRLSETVPCRILRGWELKAYAILHSSFREVLFLDADNVPVTDPTYLFDTREYQECGAVFWPDIPHWGSGSVYNSPIWALCGIEAPQGKPEFESGQILIHKEVCWQPLNLTMWLNEHSDFFYQYIYGDKDTFNIAWCKLAVLFAMPSKPLSWVGDSMHQHDFMGLRLFQHRNGAKWRREQNRLQPDFWFESDCLRYIFELAGQWDGSLANIPRWLVDREAAPVIRTAAQILVSGLYLYRIVGAEERLLTFHPDGTIAQGKADLEMFWDIQDEGGLCLSLSSNTQVTCRLRQHEDGIWRGRWCVFEGWPIEVHPLRKPAENLASQSSSVAASAS